MKSRRHYFLALALALTAAAAPVSRAGDQDHDRARQAVEAGEVLPLRTVLAQVEREYPGQVMEVELEREHGLWVYEIKVLRPGGELLKLEVDARSGRTLEGKRGRRGEH
ncbi:MAG TPA: hypothetical protein DHV59_13030 [Oxalobacteraceae bacterium]|nr:hypothetical protein [Oxalobacteraceae bacterium]